MQLSWAGNKRDVGWFYSTGPPRRSINLLEYAILATTRHKKSRWRYLGNEERYRSCAEVKMTGSFRAFQIFKTNGFLDIWILRSGGHILQTNRATRDLPEAKLFQENFFFLISRFGGDILELKRATEDPLVAKLPDYKELFKFSKKWISGFLDLVAISWKLKEQPEIRWWQNDRKFLSFSDWKRYVKNPKGAPAKSQDPEGP